MRIGIAGAGAVGCHYGARLQQAGCTVRFLARGEHLAALQAHGMVHRSPQGETVLPVTASDDAGLLADCDLILLASKATGLDALCEQLKPVVAGDAVLMTVQNGVRAPDLVAGHFPAHAVIAASAFIGARIDEPGVVVHSAAGHIRFGCWQGDAAVAMRELERAWQRAGVDARQVDDIRAMLWNKLLWNCGFNAMTALTRRYARDLAIAPDSLRWVRAAMAEGLAVAAAAGVELERQAIDRHIELTLGGGPVKTSMWQDMERGRPTEIEEMNGFIAAEAVRLGIAAPVNDLLASLVRAAERPPA